jgi:hypothetical protein
MMMNVRCQDKERLIAYLYDDQSAEERDRVEAHLAECRVCAQEIAELRGVREQLTEWRAPDADLGFRIVKEPPAAPARQRSWVPAWAALPAAAIVVLAVSAAVANVEVRYDATGVTLRTGWSQRTQVRSGPGASQSTGASMTAASAEDQRWRAELAELERRLRAEFASAGHTATSVAPATPKGGDLLKQVRALVAESEERQQRELALRFAQLVHEVDSQRRADLVQIEQNLGQIEGLTAQQSEMMQYLVRVSQGR